MNNELSCRCRQKDLADLGGILQFYSRYFMSKPKLADENVNQ